MDSNQLGAMFSYTHKHAVCVCMDKELAFNFKIGAPRLGARLQPRA